MMMNEGALMAPFFRHMLGACALMRY